MNINCVALDKDFGMEDRSVTGRAINVSLGVSADGSFTVHGATAASDGATIVSNAEDTVRCKRRTSTASVSHRACSKG